MKDRILNIVLVGLIAYLAIYFLFLKEDPYQTKVENPNFSLEIKLNGLEEDKDYLWVFSSLEPGIGVATIDFRTGEINPKMFTRLKFKNGKLKINGRIEEPGLYTLRNINDNEELVFMLDSCEQKIEAEVKELRADKYMLGYNPFTYSGSKLNKEYFSFWDYPKIKEFNNSYLTYLKWSKRKVKEIYGISLREYTRKLMKGESGELRQNLKVSKKEEIAFIDERKSKVTKVILKKQKAVLQFVKENPNTTIGLDYLLCYVYLLGNEKPNFENMSQYMPLIGDQLQNTSTYKYLRESYALEGNLQVGNLAPDFTVTDTYGDSLRLSDLRGNIVLVEFWKSSCDYCVDEKANMLEMYLKYRQKDFEILSVSFDTDRKKWLNAIDKQALPWLQYRDSIGYDCSSIIKEYAHAGIPYYYLIDKEGRIIAKALRQPKMVKSEEYNLNLQLQKIFAHKNITSTLLQ
ncbi:MAG: AhpC/TSA family protein [Marinifilum sp.]|jgi:peroxiredoxin|nr:AhpC/TSA family protein [Marinifilum sp.]